MHNLIYFYQHLPEKIDPAVFSWGFFRLDWYALMYIAGFLTVYFFLRLRIKKGENDFNFDTLKLESFLAWLFFGLILGGRIGYVLFYNFAYYLANPGAIISPLDPVSGEFIGIFGMSYHGGLVGVILAVILFSRKYRVNFWKLVNFTAPAVPAGYFFGRVGNFLNGELFGRATEKIWGMYFSDGGLNILRHPSQLYEAFFEGLILFLILWNLRNCEKIKNRLFGMYIFGYGFFRIIIEFFRAPDEQIGFFFNFLTLGQILSLAMLVAGLDLIWYGKKTEKVV